MAVYRFYYKGNLAFQLVTIPYVNEDKGEEPRQLIISSLPEEVLLDTKKNYYKWLTSNHHFFIENTDQIINELGHALLHNFKARFFFYPKELLSNNKISASTWKQLKMNKDGFKMIPATIYSMNFNSIKFYSLHLKFLTHRFYYPSKFRKEVQTIKRTEFEAILSNEEMQKEYLLHYREHNLFYKVKQKDLVAYIVCNGFTPVMIIFQE